MNSTNWANVDTGLDLVMEEVQAGDQLVYGVMGRWLNEAVASYLDVATIVSSSPVNSFAKRGAVEATPTASFGFVAWSGVASANTPIGAMAPPYTVVAGDIENVHDVTLRLRYATSTATNKTLQGSSTDPLDVWCINVGPLQA